jgi:anti-sigma regulatory factor (Ser/Thr protein kinase)
VRTGDGAGHAGYVHQALLYGSDDELLAVTLPFVEEGRAAGEPTLVAFADRNAALLRGALGDTEGIDFLAAADQYARPAAAIRSYRDLFARLVAAGADQIRVVGDVPTPADGVPWEGWARYEAAVNHAFDEFPLWGLCPYDTRTTPEEVLDDVARTHRHIARADGSHVVNDRFEDPVAFLAGRRAAPPDPLERGAPVLNLVDPSPRAARHLVAELPTALSPSTTDDLVTAVSEIVTNAIRHGIPPVRLRVWTGIDRVVVTVHDEGFGVSDPFAGLLPARDDAATGGLGLWIAHQVCSDVSLCRGDDGFTVRLVAGTPFLRA